MFRQAFLATTVSALALAAAGTVNAQSTQEAVGVVDDIVVTAQRRSENIREVPFSVATMDQETLTSVFAGGADILALAGRVPSLHVESSNGRYAPRFYIRGLGNVDFDFTASQPVSVVMDDVVLESVYLKGFPLFDIQQVEVLRGPQGTLFGRNTPAGVVKVDTAKPSDVFGGFGSVGMGNLGAYRAEAAVNLPITETVALRVAGLWNYRDDWVNNAYDAPFASTKDDDLGSFEDRAIRGHLAWTPNSQLSVLGTLQFRDYAGTGTLNRANAFNKGSNKLNDNYDRDTVYYDGGRNNFQKQNTQSQSIQVAYDFGNVTLTGVVGSYQGESLGNGDIDGGVASSAAAGKGYKVPYSVESGTGSSDLLQNTYELRLSSNGNNRLNWQVGAFYWDERFNLVSNTYNGTGNLAPTKQTDITQKSDSWSVFGQANYQLTEALKVTGGLRYTEDSRDYAGKITIGSPANATGQVSVADEQVSWDLSALYEVNSEWNVFARVASGYRGPSIQGRNLPVLTTADSETVMSYEAGFKARLLQGRARLNATAYLYEIEDLQLTAVGGADNSNRLLNADKGLGKGIEVDGDLYLGAGFTLSGGAAWNHTEIKDKNAVVNKCTGGCTITDPFVTVGGVERVSINGNPFPMAPEYTANLTLDYVKPLTASTEFFASTDWTMQKDFNIFLYEAAEFRVDTNFEGGLRAGWRNLDQGLEAAVYVRNITDEHNVIGAIDFNNLTAFVNEPRTYGVQVSKRF